MSIEEKILAAYKSNLYTRCDDVGDVFYFSYENFPKLNATPYEFKSSKGHILRGAFYNYDGAKEGRIVIFDHGMGGGHRSYMREIVELTQHGYTVLAYDHTGCMRSEGESTSGFSQSLRDLDDCISSLRARPEYKDTDISVIGHSWGAYAAMNIGAFHPDVTHIVGISGFLSVERMHEQLFPAFLAKYVPMLYALEKSTNPEYVTSDAISALHKTRAKALIIHSRDDKTVKAKHHFDRIRARLKDRPDTIFIELKGKRHNPNYTKDAVRYKDIFIKKLTKLRKAGKLTTEKEKKAFISGYDWYRMTEQDSDLWQKILSFLDN